MCKINEKLKIKKDFTENESDQEHHDGSKMTLVNVDIDLLQRNHDDDIDIYAYDKIMKNVIHNQKHQHDAFGNRIKEIDDRAFNNEANYDITNFYENELAFKFDS